jgi:hypothetical protein
MVSKFCVVCGAEFVANSNRQKYCSDCKNEVKLAKQRVSSQTRRAKRARLDKVKYSLGPNIPKSLDWTVEARKVNNEIKRTFRNVRVSARTQRSFYGQIKARQEALDNLVVDQRDDDWSGSIDDFFAGKDD